MKRPLYELDALRESVEQCNTNIEAFREAIKKEQIRKEEMLEYIQQHEIYNSIQKE